MKTFFLSIGLLLVLFLSCKKDENVKVNLEIISSEWYAKSQISDSNNFCEIHLKISGMAKSELLSIETFGDGLPGCSEIKCNSENNFSTDMVIYFFPSRDTTKRKFATTITAYSSKIKPNIVFCDAVGSGEVKRITLESPFLNCK
ncbi:MAG: hypothetical protein PHF97_12350 [Bacteroidales bacterium]|nr:hypothetical protein [Bacteroidales bacterium]